MSSSDDESRGPRAKKTPSALVAAVWLAVAFTCLARSSESVDEMQSDWYFWRTAAEEWRADGALDRHGEMPWYLPFATRVLGLWIGWAPSPRADVPASVEEDLARYRAELEDPGTPDASGALPRAGPNPFLAWRLENPCPTDAADRLNGALFFATNAALLLWTLVALTRLAGTSGSGVWREQLAPLIALAPILYLHSRYNQLTIATLAACVAAFVQLERGRDLRAGLFLGFAIAFKIQPALLLPWLALKRRWRALGGVAAFLVATVVLDLALLGTSGTAERYDTWVDAAHRGTAEHFVRTGEECDKDNFSVAATLRRFLVETDVAVTMPGAPPPEEPELVNVVSWTPGVVVWLNRVIVLLSLGLGAWALRRPWDRLDTDGRRRELALCLLGILWFTPLLRHYYLLLAWPALAFLRGRARTPVIVFVGICAYTAPLRETWAYSPLLWTVPVLVAAVRRSDSS